MRGTVEWTVEYVAKTTITLCFPGILVSKTYYELKFKKLKTISPEMTPFVSLTA